MAGFLSKTVIPVPLVGEEIIMAKISYEKDNVFYDDSRTAMTFRALLDHELYIMPALKEITLNLHYWPALFIGKKIVPNMFTQKVAPLEWFVCTIICDT